MNPFEMLADGLMPGGSIGAQTLVVVGITGADGRPGFAQLAGRARTPQTPTAAAARISRTTRPVRRPQRCWANRRALGLGETPVEQTDGLAIQVAVAVHLHDDEPAVSALSGGDERVFGEVGEARLAGDGASIARQQLVLSRDGLAGKLDRLFLEDLRDQRVGRGPR